MDNGVFMDKTGFCCCGSVVLSGGGPLPSPEPEDMTLDGPPLAKEGAPAEDTLAPLLGAAPAFIGSSPANGSAPPDAKPG